MGFSNLLRIYSYDGLGRRKTQGGDFWRVNVIGVNYTSAFHLRDLGNGVYEGGFVIGERGEFELVCYLEYSLCDGLRDPPPHWFKKGKLFRSPSKRSSLP